MSAVPELVVIAAVDRNGGIGIDNGLPWRLRKDLQRFRATTMGHPLIMGRKTWDSLGRPRPGRRSIVISRDPSLRLDGAERAGSLAEAMALVHGSERAFVIGGAQIYALALPIAQRLLLTEVDAALACDARFPAWSKAQFEEVAREHFEADVDNEHSFDFAEYRRITPA